MITLYCCGENYFADDVHTGGHIRCGKCGRTLTIPPRTVVPSVNPGHRTGAQSETAVGTTRDARATVGSRRSPIFKPVLGALLLVVVLASLEVHHRVNRDEQADTARKVWAPIDAQPQPRYPSSNAPAPIVPIGSPASPLAVCATVPASRSTGWIKPQMGITGRGVLSIDNGSELDAAVKLVTVGYPRHTVWEVYIRAHDRKTISAISPGRYFLRFALGSDWDGKAMFRCNVEFYQASRELGFTETEPTADEPGISREFEITLNEIPGGNLPRESIDETMFNEGEPTIYAPPPRALTLNAPS
jgi:hypothetical protein